jgi:phosphoribosylformylglycinamidine synthase
VQNALRHRGLNVTVTRRSHWEIELEDFEPESVLHQLERSGELFNSNKERLIQRVSDTPGAATFLVRPKEDLLGRHKLETIRERLEIRGIKAVRSGVLWNINIIGDNFNGCLDEVMATNILFNPFSHNCYRK